MLLDAYGLLGYGGPGVSGASHGSGGALGTRQPSDADYGYGWTHGGEGNGGRGQRLGLRACHNRPCSLVAVPMPSFGEGVTIDRGVTSGHGEGEAGAVAYRVMSARGLAVVLSPFDVISRSPRPSPCGKYVAFLQAGIGLLRPRGADTSDVLPCSLAEVDTATLDAAASRPGPRAGPPQRPLFPESAGLGCHPEGTRLHGGGDRIGEQDRISSRRSRSERVEAGPKGRGRGRAE